MPTPHPQAPVLRTSSRRRVTEPGSTRDRATGTRLSESSTNAHRRRPRPASAHDAGNTLRGESGRPDRADRRRSLRRGDDLQDGFDRTLAWTMTGRAQSRRHSSPRPMAGVYRALAASDRGGDGDGDGGSEPAPPTPRGRSLRYPQSPSRTSRTASAHAFWPASAGGSEADLSLGSPRPGRRQGSARADRPHLHVDSSLKERGSPAVRNSAWITNWQSGFPAPGRTDLVRAPWVYGGGGGGGSFPPAPLLASSSGDGDGGRTPRSPSQRGRGEQSPRVRAAEGRNIITHGLDEPGALRAGRRLSPRAASAPRERPTAPATTRPWNAQWAASDTWGEGQPRGRGRSHSQSRQRQPQLRQEPGAAGAGAAAAAAASDQASAPPTPAGRYLASGFDDRGAGLAPYRSQRRQRSYSLPNAAAGPPEEASAPYACGYAGNPTYAAGTRRKSLQHEAAAHKDNTRILPEPHSVGYHRDLTSFAEQGKTMPNPPSSRRRSLTCWGSGYAIC